MSYDEELATRIRVRRQGAGQARLTETRTSGGLAFLVGGTDVAGSLAGKAAPGCAR